MQAFYLWQIKQTGERQRKCGFYQNHKQISAHAEIKKGTAKSMAVRTDLAMESASDIKNINFEGIQYKTEHKNGMDIDILKVESEGAAMYLGKPIGSYITVQTSDFRGVVDDFCNEIDVIASIITRLLPQEYKNVLVVGLGNKDITPDALGPLAVESILVTRHIDEETKKQIGMEGLCGVSAVAPGVLGQTGVESTEIVAALVNRIEFDCVIAIDALAAKSLDRLATTIQICNTGISPGSGVLNSRRELTNATLNVPVIAVGVPTVVDMATIASDLLGEDIPQENTREARAMMVTPREIDLAVAHAAKTVAFAINKALQPSLTLDELTALVS